VHDLITCESKDRERVTRQLVRFDP